MNIIRLLICLLIVSVFVKLLLDVISIIKNNSDYKIMEGMENQGDVAKEVEKAGAKQAKKVYSEYQEELAEEGLLKPSKKNKPHNLGPGGTQHLLGPGGTQKFKPHKHHSTGRRVPDDSHQHKYKKFIPDDLDQLPLTKKVYEEMGRDFMKDEAKKRGIKKTPGIHDSEAEVLGKMVWRVYAAEIEQKRANSPKAHDQLLEREIQLLNRVSKLMKSETDHHKGKGKKHKGITNQASKVPQCGSKFHVDSRTTNMYGYTPPSSNDIHREPGHAFEGEPIRGAPIYHDISNAIEHCETDRACGGVNFDSTTGKFFLMPVHARIVRRPHYTAFIKKKHRRRNNPYDHKSSGRAHGHHHGTPSPYLPETGIGFTGSPCQCKNGHPRNPNLLPRPYNSLMDLFH